MTDYTLYLWLFKLGALVNLYFLVQASAVTAGAAVVVPAQVFFAVAAYRCLFPVRYENEVVFHDSVFSSIFATRLLATFAEIGYIYLFAHVLRVIGEHDPLVGGLAWYMVFQVVVSQVCVWLAILLERFRLYFYEELGWLLIFVANTVASAYLYLSADVPVPESRLLLLSLVFAAGYLPFQLINLVGLRAQAQRQEESRAATPWTLGELRSGLLRSIRRRNRRTDGESWGGVVGLLWMVGYLATLLPWWMFYIVSVLAES